MMPASGAGVSPLRSPGRAPGCKSSVVFELLQPELTLTELQRTVKTISGRYSRKQIFRRLA